MSGTVEITGRTALKKSVSVKVLDDGSVVLKPATGVVVSGTTELTPKFAKIDRATNADGAAVVAKVSGKKIRVLKYSLLCAGATGVKWQSSTSDSSGAGVNTDLTPVMSYAANGGIAGQCSRCVCCYCCVCGPAFCCGVKVLCECAI